MADELTSPVVAPEQAPAGQPEPASPEPRPAQTGKQKESGSINLQEVPEFRNWQKQMNQTMERQRKEAQAEITRLQQQVEQLATRDMSDEERTARQVQKLQDEIQRRDERYNELYQTYAQDLAKAEIARRAGVSPEVFAEANDPDEAWELALKARLKQEIDRLEAEYKDKMASSPGNSPDLGAGQPKSATRSFSDMHWQTNDGLRDFYRQLQDEWNG